MATDNGWGRAGIEAWLESCMMRWPDGRRFGTPADITTMALVDMAVAAEAAAVVEAVAQEQWLRYDDERYNDAQESGLLWVFLRQQQPQAQEARSLPQAQTRSRGRRATQRQWRQL